MLKRLIEVAMDVVSATSAPLLAALIAFIATAVEYGFSHEGIPPIDVILTSLTYGALAAYCWGMTQLFRDVSLKSYPNPAKARKPTNVEKSSFPVFFIFYIACFIICALLNVDPKVKDPIHWIIAITVVSYGIPFVYIFCAPEFPGSI